MAQLGPFYPDMATTDVAKRWRTQRGNPVVIQLHQFGKLPSFILVKLCRCPPSWLSVYAAFALYRGREGLVWPAIATIAEITGLHPSSVKKAVKGLRAEGLLVARGFDTSRTRRYYLPQLPEELPSVAAVSAPLKSVAEALPQGRSTALEGARCDSAKGRNATTQTDKEQNEQLPELGEIGEQIRSDGAFCALAEYERWSFARQVEELCRQLQVPASRISDLITEAWKEDRDRIPEHLLRLLRRASDERSDSPFD